jgi:hypothetical protein
MKKSKLNRAAGHKLQLDTEVLRRLNAAELQVVAAGACLLASMQTTSYPTVLDANAC